MNNQLPKYDTFKYGISSRSFERVDNFNFKQLNIMKNSSNELPTPKVDQSRTIDSG